MAPKRGILASGREASQTRRREFTSLVRAAVPVSPITRGRAGSYGTGSPIPAATVKRITPPQREAWVSRREATPPWATTSPR